VLSLENPQIYLVFYSLIRTFASDNIINGTIMTSIELRTSIAKELDQMSVEMLENVSHYVRRLRSRVHSVRQSSDAVRSKRNAALQFVKSLSVVGPMSVPADERGIDVLVNEKYDK